MTISNRRSSTLTRSAGGQNGLPGANVSNQLRVSSQLAPLGSPLPLTAVSIELEDYSSSSSSLTDVCDDDNDWSSVRRLSAPVDGTTNARSNPLDLMRSLLRRHGSARPKGDYESGLEMNKLGKENPMRDAYKKNKNLETTSVLNGRRRLSLAFLQDMVPMDEEENSSMGVFMGSHLERALRLTHAKSSRIYLGFLNNDVEDDYRSYFWTTMKKRWSLFIGFGGGITIALQVAGLLGLNGDGLLGGSSAVDWGILIAVMVIPLLVIAFLPAVLKERDMAFSVHMISLVFVLITGPVMCAIRYTNKHMQSSTDAFNPSVTAPIYIVSLVASVFFLRLRFIHTVGATVVAAGTWYSVLASTAVGAVEREAFIMNSIVLLFACIVICFISYDLERSLRHQYLSNSRFLSITKNLKSQLDGLERSLLYSAAKNGIPTADLSSPLERAMLAIRGMMADESLAPEHLGVLELVLACLSSPNLLTPDLDVQVQEGNVAIDDEQEKWLFNEVATRETSRRDGAGLEQIPFETFKFGESAEYESNVDEGLAVIPANTANSSRRPSAASSFCTPTTLLSTEDLQALFEFPPTKKLLGRVQEFNFPIFEFVKLTENRPLVVLSNHLIRESGLLSKLGLDEFKFHNFLTTIEAGYHADLAFHNSVHATDVLHCINYMVSLSEVKPLFNDLEVLAILIAAIIHDFDHPGVSNSYLVATADRRALLYNDKAVLENHHCSSAFEVLARKECSFLSTLDRADYKSFRENVVDMVLATDLAQHFTLLTNFKKKVMAAETFNPSTTREDRTLLMQMLMKCSDVSNPTKQWAEYSIWIEKIHEEWYRQGDMEKARGLPFSPFCNRDGPHASNPASSQTGFINFIVSPLFEAFNAWTPIDEIWRGLEENKNRWNEMNPESQTSVKKPKPSALTMPNSPKLSTFKSPMRLKSATIFSPSSPVTPGSMMPSSAKTKVARSKSTSNAPSYLAFEDGSIDAISLSVHARLNRRGSDARSSPSEMD